MSHDVPVNSHAASTNSLKYLQYSTFLAKPKVITFYKNLALIGAGLLLGDGVITPSISVLSAVEGLELLGGNLTEAVVPITCAIIIVLFSFQRFGTAKVGLFFGQIMLTWFAALSILGIYHIASYPSIFCAFNPYYGLHFFYTRGKEAWVLMGAIVLCVTGNKF